MTMNRIPMLQNEAEQIKLLQARTHVYGLANWLMVLQLLLTLVLPVVGAVLVVFYPEFRAYVAAFSLGVVIIDAPLLDRKLKLLIGRAAKIAEQFDCTVLDLPWDQFTVGDQVEAEDIHAAARSFARRHSSTKLEGWYPEVVGTAPLHLARIICQRTNLRYDSQLRRSYGTIIKIAALALLVGLVVSGLIQDLQITGWVLSMAPAVPFLSWAAREYYRQRDTADLLEGLMKEANVLWGQVRAGECDSDACRQRSRQFQNAIYGRRANSALILPFLYRFKRSGLEDEMNEGAAAMLRSLGNVAAPASHPPGADIARPPK
jgi:hypothetical protein